MQVDLKLTF